jgi:hypothetical protein
MRRVVSPIMIAGVLALAGCGGGEPTASDLPPGVVTARPSITTEEARFVLAAKKLGVDVSGQSVDDDVETATTTCWALKEGGVTLGEIARESDGKPLPNEGDGLRTKRIMYAAVQALCPKYDSQLGELDLPG